jgi:hypothetical protein
MHPLWFVVLPFLAVVVTIEVTTYIRTGRWAIFWGRHVRTLQLVACAIVALLFAVWIARFLGALGGPCPAE